MAKIGRTTVRLAGALLLGAGAARIDNPTTLETPTSSSRVATAPVVVAATEIQPGQRIDRRDVMIAEWPVAALPAGAYSSVDSVVNHVARIPVFKGEAILPGRLGQEREAAGQQVRITPGKRAFSIRIDDPDGIVGMIKPNSRVDVLVTLETREPERRIPKIFMSNMRVLAIGTVVRRAPNARAANAYVVTLEVTPEEAEQLAIAASQGSLSLALRGRGDSDSTVTFGTTLEDVEAKTRSLQPSRADTSRVRRFRGPR